METTKTKIVLDSSMLDAVNSEMQKGLDIDLERMQKLNLPVGTDTIKVIPINSIYRDSLTYLVQFGRMFEEKFIPVTRPERFSHESLPY